MNSKRAFDVRTAAQRMVEEGKAPDYYTACSMLARRPRHKRGMQPAQATKPTAPASASTFERPKWWDE